MPSPADARGHSTRACDATRTLDLNDIARGDGVLFVREGVGFAGRGVAARLAIDDVPAALAAIEHVDESGLSADAPRPGVGPVGARVGAVRARRRRGGW